MMQFIKQCKGKDLTKVPLSKLEDKYYSSIKYDGHYVQIHKYGDVVRFFTSGGKEFYHEAAADELLLSPSNFIIEAEFIADTDGSLGNRGKAAKLTTYRTNYSKCIANIGLSINKDKFMVFDIISYNNTFDTRLSELRALNFNGIVKLVDFNEPLRINELNILANSVISSGFEGLFLKSPSHIYAAGKRVNNAIKIKKRITADLLCISVNPGEGKYIGMIGSLVLKDSEGTVVSVGSGLSDIDRVKSPGLFINKIIEISYEQILDTYIQPVYIDIRNDK